MMLSVGMKPGYPGCVSTWNLLRPLGMLTRWPWGKLMRIRCSREHGVPRCPEYQPVYVCLYLLFTIINYKNYVIYPQSPNACTESKWIWLLAYIPFTSLHARMIWSRLISLGFCGRQKHQCWGIPILAEDNMHFTQRCKLPAITNHGDLLKDTKTTFKL